MQVLILGSAAGGGFPQWNCNCDNCRGVRQGRVGLSPRTQSSIAVSMDGERWLLCNASPDIRAQLNAHPALWPTRGLRDSGIAEVLLVDAQIDHVSGLLSLREGCPFDVWCTPRVHDDLSSGFPLFPMLRHWNGGLAWREIPLADACERCTFRVPSCPELEITALSLSSNAPPYSPRRGSPATGDNLGLLFHDRLTGGALFYAPGLGEPSDAARALMAEADCVLVDGTLWHDDEMARLGITDATGREMGHLALAGEGGMIAELDALPETTRRILIHINNTNPILDETSAERAVLDRHGIEVAHDGMQLTL
ncbi:pyrroloquinoline quinone biosynthesis protein PqqB [Halomonas sp. MCCC 1A17488]|uniref:Coenzyme PQQ synthesis protein B n=1 Tax=Billgrantia sulfidoxydans TaxID=2733484 RepID=A0ABX7W917_9GAMM|nr:MULTISPECIES: pyrroloquinoline quinone biosynthesis protein PqqB [Halomonas]MCE8017518.1 pyrroloquinoline quinone biosynthesis protein PqqB [Halomonas sp. MCCC 1A17488]MCG3240851.1 pyrroloquinoline quinone biosynthesis protein PqqB [Halomonas sp. MCCC 1A17488]QPP48728.1 pyrroloquinoline quinone biosynthesis protein PqqB [Halomonas sp. SS10-MC5]QTP56067.1 pyrroloquinoline quinone biosynthesis protein PqqB [Halomonas sulfidoxydans]